MIEFNATPRKSADTTLVTIPAAYVRDGHITPGKAYRFTAQEADDAE